MASCQTFNRYYNLLVRAQPHLLPDFCTGSSQSLKAWDTIVWLSSFLCRWETIAKFQPNHCALPTVYHLRGFLSEQMKSEHIFLWHPVWSFKTAWKQHSWNLMSEVDASTSGTRDRCLGRTATSAGRGPSSWLACGKEYCDHSWRWPHGGLVGTGTFGITYMLLCLHYRRYSSR